MGKFEHDTIVPYEQSTLGKKEQIADMFNRIALRYDFLNRFLSIGTDLYWRKKAIRELKDLRPGKLLDVATGTGDMAILMTKYLRPNEIIGRAVNASAKTKPEKHVSLFKIPIKVPCSNVPIVPKVPKVPTPSQPYRLTIPLRKTPNSKLKTSIVWNDVDFVHRILAGDNTSKGGGFPFSRE